MILVILFLIRHILYVHHLFLLRLSIRFLSLLMLVPIRQFYTALPLNMYIALYGNGIFFYLNSLYYQIPLHLINRFLFLKEQPQKCIALNLLYLHLNPQQCSIQFHPLPRLVFLSCYSHTYLNTLL